MGGFITALFPNARSVFVVIITWPATSYSLVGIVRVSRVVRFEKILSKLTEINYGWILLDNSIVTIKKNSARRQ